MQLVLMGLNPDCGPPSLVSVHIDDILIFSTTLKEHIKHICLVLQHLCEVGLKLKPSKCHFMRKQVEYLGHILTPDGLKPNPTLVQAVKEFLVPTSVRRFLGLASYYWRFTPKFASIAQPLHQLTCKRATFKWAEAAMQAFEELKEKLTTSPVLAYPTFDRDFVLEKMPPSQVLVLYYPKYKETEDCIRWRTLVGPLIHMRETTA